MFKGKQETVALYGGSFDPPHIGHLAIVEEALKSLGINRLIVVPTFLNPFKTDSHHSPDERLKQSNKLFGKIPKVLVDDYEIQEGKATSSAKTLRHFQKRYSVKYIIIGADNLDSITKWYNFNWLNSNITWVIATRAGYKLDTTALQKFKILKVEMDISSTEIRRKLMNLDERIDRIVTELDNKKAEEIEAFNLEKVDYIVERVVLANSLGGKHASSLAQHLKDKLKPLGEEFLHIDESDDWVVIDMGDILVHIMSSEARQTYCMEEFLMEISNRKSNEEIGL
ncbi:nicotinate (nicotinamide) nucleotide adenylyltransferase [Sulfurovum sp. bin170]|uniref:nicotinate (nicotinamide) nucleotide adenylyltransferase n=1 Tax=Sulfurovum sp. bin170 TaxID=2695268 RepID=UPI0013DF2352|nr:nicotinate (nicotinamide) nucleotide adenylyltransferase [Sulfurovum sp. bin170]NEW59959.1 nicotinate (nicotinamide) nucleotide adenylyltransferase [Sulfurovum sp. bin170]